MQIFQKLLKMMQVCSQKTKIFIRFVFFQTLYYLIGFFKEIFVKTFQSSHESNMGTDLISFSKMELAKFQLKLFFSLKISIRISCFFFLIFLPTKSKQIVFRKITQQQLMAALTGCICFIIFLHPIICSGGFKLNFQFLFCIPYYRLNLLHLARR